MGTVKKSRKQAKLIVTFLVHKEATKEENKLEERKQQSNKASWKNTRMCAAKIAQRQASKLKECLKVREQDGEESTQTTVQARMQENKQANCKNVCNQEKQAGKIKNKKARMQDSKLKYFL